MAKLAMLLLSFVLCGCASPVPSFELTNATFKLRGTTIAVLAGLDNELSPLFARAVSDALKKQSTFRVISQPEIARILISYPSDIRGPYTAAYFSIKYDYENTDRVKLKEVSRKLGADYIYVIWVPTTYWRESLYNILETAQLFEFPAGKERGRSDLRIPVSKGNRKWSCCLMPFSAPADADIKSRILAEADKMAKEIAENTGTARVSPKEN